MQRYFAEAIGTFFLVLVGTGAVAANDLSNGAVTHVGISLSFGLIVAVMIYAIGKVSGCHINPAVTIAFFAAGKFNRRDVLPYVLTQCGAAIAGSYVVQLAFGPEINIGATVPQTTAIASLLLEFLMTALLMFVVLQVADGSQLCDITAGGVIGCVIAFEALFGGPLSGASMNPARSLGPALIAGQWTHHWVYWAGPISGGLVGIVLHRILLAPECPAESESDTADAVRPRDGQKERAMENEVSAPLP